ncbi:MAG: pilin [Candidatus Saccharimonadales bacterium]
MKLAVKSILLFATAAILILLAPALVAAVDCNATNLTTQQAIQCGTQGAGGGDPSEATTSVNSTIAGIVNILTVIVGIVAVVMIIVAGFRYITSGGASDKVKSAKDTLIYAIIGLIVVVLAQVIARFVLTETTSTTSTSDSAPTNNTPTRGSREHQPQ